MIRKLSYTLIASLTALLALEGVSRLAEAFAITRDSASIVQFENAGWQTEFFQSFLGWHQPDSDLLWRFKPHLNNPLMSTNAQGCLGGEFSHPKSTRAKRILVLGDSTPVGLGLRFRAQAFPELLTAALALIVPEHNSVELVNAAVSGYTSEQLKLLLNRDGALYEPNLVIVYVGNNDASISGSRSDRELLGSSLSALGRILLRNFALVRSIRRILGMFGAMGANLSEAPLRLRVSPTEFSENISEMAKICESAQIPIIFIKPVVPRLWPAGIQFKPFSHYRDTVGEYIMPERLRDMLGKDFKYCFNKKMQDALYGTTDIFPRLALAAAEEGSLHGPDAVAHFETLVSQNPRDALFRNNLGVSLWEIKSYDRSMRELQLARTLFAEANGFPHGDISMRSAGSAILFNIGICALFKRSDDFSALIGQLDIKSPSKLYLDSALEEDFFSLRIKNEYLSEIDRVVERSISGDIFTLDLTEVFRSKGGERLFVDHCHPTAEGHKLIAMELFKVIIDRDLLAFNENE